MALAVKTNPVWPSTLPNPSNPTRHHTKQVLKPINVNPGFLLCTVCTKARCGFSTRSCAIFVKHTHTHSQHIRLFSLCAPPPPLSGVDTPPFTLRSPPPLSYRFNLSLARSLALSLSLVRACEPNGGVPCCHFLPQGPARLPDKPLGDRQGALTSASKLPPCSAASHEHLMPLHLTAYTLNTSNLELSYSSALPLQLSPSLHLVMHPETIHNLESMARLTLSSTPPPLSLSPCLLLSRIRLLSDVVSIHPHNATFVFP
jgi:hypothetical protein